MGCEIKNVIGGRRWDVATQKRKVCNTEIEIVTFVVNGNAKFTVPTDITGISLTDMSSDCPEIK